MAKDKTSYREAKGNQPEGVRGEKQRKRKERITYRLDPRGSNIKSKQGRLSINPDIRMKASASFITIQEKTSIHQGQCDFNGNTLRCLLPVRLCHQTLDDLVENHRL